MASSEISFMNTMSKRIIYMAIVLLTVACTASEDNNSQAEGGNVPVKFEARMGAALATRNGPPNTAKTDIASNFSLSSQNGFGVFGCYTGLHGYSDSNVHPDFMYNEHVTSSDGGLTWTYSPIKYWPNGEGEVAGNTGNNPHYVSFMAYAPWSNNSDSNPDDNPAGYCISSFSQQGEYGNPWLTYRLIPQENLDKQVDLLCARPVLDKKKPYLTDPDRITLFEFNHALACVGNKVNVICSEGLKSQIDNRVNGSVRYARVEVTSLEIEYTLTSKARLVLWNNGVANWQTILSENPTCTRIVKIIDSSAPEVIYISSGSSASYLCEGKGVYYIPEELATYPQTAKVSINYRIEISEDGNRWTTDKDISGTATLVLHDFKDGPNSGYQPGKHLYINISLSPMDIALTAAIAPWIDVEPVEIEGIEQ